MVKLNLEANGAEQQAVLLYLQENASDTLADKINNGVYIEKDGKRLLNKKDLNGFMQYACSEAKKLAEKGAKSACVIDNVVYGWAIHFFEEESIEGTLFNEDGTEYKKVVPVQPKTTVTTKPIITKPKKNEGQVSIFDINLDEKEPDDEEQDNDVDETEEAETPSSGTGQAAEIKATVTTPTPKVTEPRAAKPTLQETQSTATPQVNSAELFYYKYTLIQKQYPEHIVFYRLGDFYEALNDSAEKASNALNVTLTGKNCGSYGRSPMCGIPCHAVDKYIDKLRNKYDVALMHSDKELQLCPKKKFEDIVQENAEKLDELADDNEFGLVIDEDTDQKIDGLNAHDYNKYFNNLEEYIDKTTGEIKAPQIDKNLFDILYKLFDGQIVME